ncbi:hypothetical protein R1flu_017549 [Riccia fluitans]|uniref:Uncharacterized protein n=1 Tax=Riccia fluitans TaxID=41844 RepID=A0ABD1ZEK9_9MARC
MKSHKQNNTSNEIVKAEFSFRERHNNPQGCSLKDCISWRLLRLSGRIPMYRALIYRPDKFETEAVENRCIVTSEPKLFKGLGYEDFNEYLSKHNILTGDDPLTTRLRLRQHHTDPVKSGGTGSPTSQEISTKAKEAPLNSYGIDSLELDGFEKMTPLEIAVQLVGQVQSSAYFVRPEHFIIRVAEEATILFNRMLGKHVIEGSKQWKAFQASQEANNEIQFILNVYVDLTHVLCTFLEKEGLGVIDYPDYVHMIME